MGVPDYICHFLVYGRHPQIYGHIIITLLDCKPQQREPDAKSLKALTEKAAKQGK